MASINQKTLPIYQLKYTTITVFMRILLQLFLTIILGVVFVGTQPKNVFAIEGFQTTLEATYVVHSNGNTSVKKIFTVTNQKSTVYLQRYGVELGSGKLQNVRVYNSTGPIPTNIVQTDSKTTVGIQFSDKTVGRDKSHQFIVEYTDPEITTIVGNSLALFIPALAKTTDISAYSVTVNVPPNFTQPSFVRPEPSSVTTDASFTTLSFPNSSGKDGIWINFGQDQYFLLDLTYTLKNPSGGQGEVQIVLPSDTAFQIVNFVDITPQPNRIHADQDGNWIASYELNSEESTTVQASVLVHTSVAAFASRPHISPTSAHTSGQENWPIHHQLIQRVKHNYPTAQDIYNFVRNSIVFSPSINAPQTIDQLLATNALGHPTDFTNLFMTVARANKIASRQVRGVVMNSHLTFRPVTEGRHLWVEYYDQTDKIWKMSDPFWAQTSGGEYFAIPDLNRVALVHQGMSPDSPNLHGAGELSSAQLQLDQTAQRTPTQLAVELELVNSLPTALIGQRPVLRVKNLTGQAWYKLPVHITFTTDRPAQELTLPDLLPFQTVEFPLDIFSTSLTSAEPVDATISIHENQLKTTIRPASLLTKYQLQSEDMWILTTGMAVGTFTSGFTFYSLRKRRLRQKKQQKKKK